MSEDPDFGPSGYLPDRAARRARKIILRAPLGLQWVIASVVAGLVVVVAGVVFLLGADEPPGAPFVAVGAVEALAPATLLADHDVLLVTAGDRVRAFTEATAQDIGYCDASRRIESSDGGVWTLTGRGTGGRASLAEHPAVVHGGTVYLDPTRRLAGAAPLPAPAEPTC